MKYFLSALLVSIFFLSSACGQVNDLAAQGFDISDIEKTSQLDFEIIVEKFSENMITVSLQGINETHNIQGLDVAVSVPEGMQVDTIELHPSLKQNNWLTVNNLENTPVLATAVGIETIKKDTQVYAISLSGTSEGTVTVSSSVIENQKQYGQIDKVDF